MRLPSAVGKALSSIDFAEALALTSTPSLDSEGVVVGKVYPPYQRNILGEQISERLVPAFHDRLESLNIGVFAFGNPLAEPCRFVAVSPMWRAIAGYDAILVTPANEWDQAFWSNDLGQLAWTIDYGLCQIDEKGRRLRVLPTDPVAMVARWRAPRLKQTVALQMALFEAQDQEAIEEVFEQEAEEHPVIEEKVTVPPDGPTGRVRRSSALGLSTQDPEDEEEFPVLEDWEGQEGDEP